MNNTIMGIFDNKYGYGSIERYDINEMIVALKEDIKYVKSSKDTSNRNSAIDKRNRIGEKCKLMDDRYDKLKLELGSTKELRQVDDLLDNLNSLLSGLGQAIAEW